MKPLAALIILPCVLALAVAEQMPVERIHLPCTAWAKPLPGGPIRTFFGSESPSHQVLWNALQDVIDLDASTYSTHGFGGATWARDEALKQPFQLYIFSPAIWDGLKPEQRSFILGQVHDKGAGLIMIAKPEDELQPDLAPVLDSKDDPTKELTEYVTRAVPVKALGIQLDFAARVWGKGRVVWMAWGDFSPYPPFRESSWKNTKPPQPCDAAEDYALATSSRVMLWAAKRDSVFSVRTSVYRIDEISVYLPPKPDVDSVQVILRNEAGAILHTMGVKPMKEQRVSLPTLPETTYAVDAFAIRNDLRIEWASVVLNNGFVPPSPITITIDKETYRPFETVTGTVLYDGRNWARPAKGEVQLQLADTNGRIVDAASQPIQLGSGNATAQFALRPGPPFTAKHTVRATMICKGQAVDSASTWFTVDTRSRDADTFHAFTLIDSSRTANRFYIEYLKSKGLTAITGEHAWDMALDAGLGVFTNFHTIGNKLDTLKDVIKGTRRYSPTGYLYSDEAPMTREELAQMKSAISTLDRGGRGGLSGVAMYRPESPRNLDAFGFISNMDFFIGYMPAHHYSPNFWQCAGAKIIRSFISKDALWGTWTGYYPWGDLDGFHRVQPWVILLNGGNLISLFMQHSDAPFWFQLADGSLTQEAGWMFEEIRELQGGIAQQVRAVPRVSPKVAVYWPKTRTKEAYGWVEGLNGFCFALDDLGYDYDFIADEEIAAGELVKRGYQVFIIRSACRRLIHGRPPSS